jgi:type II secretory pathway component PulF
LADNNIDILGFGLTGASGLMKYLATLAATGFGLFLFYRATTRGVLWVSPIQRLLMHVPKLGTALETFAMSRLAWAMHVTMNSGMELRRALKLSLSSTHNVLYTQHIDRILAEIRSGREIHEALEDTGAFPIHFIDAVQVGEQSGQLVESLANLSSHYQDEARSAMNILTVMMGVAVTGLIAAAIIFMIFRVFGFYSGVLNDAMKI